MNIHTNLYLLDKHIASKDYLLSIEISHKFALLLKLRVEILNINAC